MPPPISTAPSPVDEGFSTAEMTATCGGVASWPVKALFYDKSRDVATAAATPLTPNGYTKDDEREDRQPHGTIYSH
jgi:hypothetical protein